METINFEIQLAEKLIYISIIDLSNSIFIWVGDKSSQFNNLNIASCSNFSTTPLAVDLLGHTQETLSLKLTKRLNKQVLLSFNLQFSELEKQSTHDLILKEIINKLK